MAATRALTASRLDWKRDHSTSRALGGFWGEDSTPVRATDPGTDIREVGPVDWEIAFRPSAWRGGKGGSLGHCRGDKEVFEVKGLGFRDEDLGESTAP